MTEQRTNQQNTNSTQKRGIFRRGKKQPVKKPVEQLPNYAFIDSQNLNLGTQKVGWKMNWKKFREFLQERYNVEKAFMFIGYVPENESLYHQMQEAGYTVVLKPTVDMYMTEEELADENHVTKGNADAELVLHAMKELSNYNRAVVVSGDGDFFCLVEYLQQQKKLLHLLAPNQHYSSLYRPYEDRVVVLDTFRRELSYGPTRRQRPPKSKKTNAKRKPTSSKK